ELLADGKVSVDEVVFAMPSAVGKRVREIVQVLNEAKLKFETVPSLEQLVNGDVRVSQIRPVELEDLLGRETVSLATDRISGLIKGRTIMVTGAGGSIGSELCRQILEYLPRQLLLVERCEVQIFQIEQELLGRTPHAPIVALVADIMDDLRMRGLFERFSPEVVFHAAAHKHVPMMESQPYEAFRNNAIGTKKLANLAAKFGVDRFILISTDKAINPTNVMGATKRLAEIYLQALQRHNGTPTKFMAVRFGNVLGSSGSVIPTFKRQIAAGGPVTVTHPDVTRYFMTIPEAAGLVLQSATQGQGGEIFVLDMGKLLKIADVARQLIELSGLKPDVDIEIKYTGLRPGEKLFEELNLAAEDTIPTDHPKVMRFVGVPRELESFRGDLLQVQDRAVAMSADQVKLELQKLLPEYKPYLSEAKESRPALQQV
ncbi:MAG TPA: nucleoside-diphosphate sugar epimerase/dehydratase, partial [Chthoniobacterales bacterium]|nr:nucleoside-diphosphate sugar epimerase/dehydratase [Chthoniobacterales bacterium]